MKEIRIKLDNKINNKLLILSRNIHPKILNHKLINKIEYDLYNKIDDILYNILNNELNIELYNGLI